MFKNIGIYIKEKAYQEIDNEALHSLISSLKNHTSQVFIEDDADYQNDSVTKLSNKEFGVNDDCEILLLVLARKTHNQKNKS